VGAQQAAGEACGVTAFAIVVAVAHASAL
jgi:hypothetical protein